MANLRIISSSEGGWGSWTAYQSCGGDAYLKSFKLRVETDQRVGDDTAANNIMFYCSNGKTLTGHGLTWGTWGRGSSTCHRGICGIKTKVEEAQGWGDDTALNDVRFTCC
ncbi:vitelline membrane outer layer protein 1 homolog [Engraulis encrasicolus]|uniref:vitelline membrane outer layer protein 1 homolog n=1 Tax=Engraulis encrasicolus TaxID=184585 RepID=UPI002FD291AE